MDGIVDVRLDAGAVKIREAEAATGVGWNYLAAVNLIETRLGSIAGTSTAGAQGPMQFLPSTGAAVARELGLPFSQDRLWDPDFNMTLGSYHLGDLTRNFGGSMLLTTVGYNAGPARPPQWIARCGDPRGGNVDPVDFIECAPFTETRNYMMRVMENMQVYRARLNGGSAPLRLSEDLRRGAPAGPAPYTAYTPETDTAATPYPAD